ncbi:S-adenosyl-methyltransferase [Candidatus Kinetoplastibacterium blastocrithidii TCC012E]|uniref:Ribosomal RNA small subunit methyltransferase H n=1 Tax=Candidatus Kinetoplastidibacterium blastocrithidiae TCC012E TaxID=1208922 RepID=M1M4H4_9PROT|nr:16S rRNA (cytosine(1402)-N(4))-methyltransferase RsmH [Candidatus Kinetoplastibacterium blastocrithidii]AFZ83880.1 16S rRNA (cytosine1402-N4)-methyltransferase [Candidatus Kinetoplastibacterium blastocrithidii (ex Strigomonas culicis)]AGF49999.1 S-adenosyl-methyltransferase [Candidatus Kinetoplastibacterium blastocrithidii TCC012E]
MSDFKHNPVLLRESIEALLIRNSCDGKQYLNSGIFVDGTYGRGGHSIELLNNLDERSKLFVFDKDPDAITAASLLSLRDPRVHVIHNSFVRMEEELLSRNINKVDGIMLDLGVSSPQLDDSARGFSFLHEGPLDMRMDTTKGVTVAKWLEKADIEEIRKVIFDYGDERFATKIAREIVSRRKIRPIRTTTELVKCVLSVVHKTETGKHPATRTFQALRIHINNELEELSLAFPSFIKLLKPYGRLVAISFHSLEDRIVKRMIRNFELPSDFYSKLPLTESELPKPILRSLGRIFPGDHEILENKRSRSAVLRIAERTAAPFSDFLKSYNPYS